MMQDNSFNQDIEQKLEGFLIDPSEKVWDAVEKELDRKKRRYFFMWYWLLPALILGTGLVWMGTKKEDLKKETPTATNKKNNLFENADKQLKITTLDSPVQLQKPVTTATAPITLNNTDSLYAFDKIKWNEKSRLSATIKNGVAIYTGESDTTNNTAITPDENKSKAILPANKEEEIENEMALMKIANSETSSSDKEMEPTEKASEDTAYAIKKTDSASLLSTTIDSTQTTFATKEKSKKNNNWQKEWNLEAGFSNLARVGSAQANSNPLYYESIGTNTSSGAQVRTSNQYHFTNGAYFSAGLNIRKKLSKKIQWTTGFQYNFQELSLNRSYAVDTLVNAGTSQYSNVVNQSFKERLQIHSINIPLLLKFSLTKKLEINTGLVNRLQLSSNWKNYENVLGKEQPYLPLFYLNPSYIIKNFSVGPVATIGLIQYKNGTRIMNFGLSLKYSAKK